MTADDLPFDDDDLSTVIANTTFMQTLMALAESGDIPEPAFNALAKEFGDAWVYWEVRDSAHTVMLRRVALGLSRLSIEDGRLFVENTPGPQAA